MQDASFSLISRRRALGLLGIALAAGTGENRVAAQSNTQPDLSGKSMIALVTGATDGLGLAVAHDLAKAGVSVILHGRNPEKLAAVSKDLAAKFPAVRFWAERADFMALAEVEGMARRILRDHKRIDILINNAGIGKGHEGGQRSTSRDGYEAMFAVNYLAAFHLTERLLPVLKASKPSRIIHVASIGQSTLDFADIHLEKPGAFEGQRAYGQSKLAQIMHAFDLAERLAGSSVTANALHPATLMPTKLAKEGWGGSADTLEEGTAATVRLAISADVASTSGRFFNKQRPGTPLAQASNAAARKQLMSLSQSLVADALKRSAVAAE